MNERLHELMMEATKDMPHCYYWPGEYVEKFAGLIVQECVSVVEGMEPGYKDYRDQIEDAFRRDCVAEIKYKFGVEHGQEETSKTI